MGCTPRAGAMAGRGAACRQPCACRVSARLMPRCVPGLWQRPHVLLSVRLVVDRVHPLVASSGPAPSHSDYHFRFSSTSGPPSLVDSVQWVHHSLYCIESYHLTPSIKYPLRPVVFQSASFPYKMFCFFWILSENLNEVSLCVLVSIPLWVP
jgi:hypothetical protein